MTDKSQPPKSPTSTPAGGASGVKHPAGRREPDFDLNALDEAPVPHRERRQRERRQSGPSRSGRGGGRGGLVMSLIAIIMLVAVSAVGFMELAALKGQMATVQKSLDSMNMLSENQYESLQDALDSADKQRGKWGKEVNDKLSFLDGEMRKLWVIAHQTNQPQIKKLESDLAETTKAAKALTDKIATNTKQLKVHDKALAKIKADEADLKEDLANLSTVKATLAEQKIRLDDVPVAMEALKLQLSELETQSAQTAQLLEQLNQYRAQVNRSIDQLTEEIRLLKGGPSQPGL